MLRWMPREGAASYFLQYSTGKFPTQLTFDAKAGEPLTAELINLTPGQTTTIEFCEARAGGRCPAPDSDTVCNSLVEVAAPWAYAGVDQPDIHKAVCSLKEQASYAGESVGYPYSEPVNADSAETCCQMCAWIGSHLPYQARCSHFVFDEASRQCRYLREAGEATAADGKVAGAVLAWPQAQE